MNNQNKHIDRLTPELIEKYLKGELSNRAMHQVEKLMLHDDFDAEAMEGFEGIDPNFIQADLQAMEARVANRMKASGKALPFYLKIAASIAFVAICTFLIIRWVDTPIENNELTHSATEDSQPPEQSTQQGTKPSAKNTEAKQNEGSTSSTHVVDELIAENKPKAKEVELQVEAGEKDTDIQPNLDLEAEPIQGIALAEDKSVSEIADTTTPPMNESIVNKLQGQAAGVQVRARSAKKLSVPKAEIMAYQDFVERPITGRVTSAEDGRPLAGVNVIAKGTTTGTVTDIDGNYKIKLPENVDSTLVFSFVGLASAEVDVAGHNVLDVQMYNDVSALSEVVVSAYRADTADSSYQSTFLASQPVGGKAAYHDYLEENVRYPANQTEKGRVVVKFKVNIDGALSDFAITKSMGKAFDQEALRLIKQGPKWKAALNNDTPVEDFVKVRVKFEPEQ